VKVDDPIPFHRPSVGPDEEAAVLRCLRSGWLTSGPEAEAFEREFAEYVGARAAVAVSSGTAALHLACVLAGWTRSERWVVVPTLTFTATAAAVVMAGATPVFADVDPETLNLSAVTLARVGGIVNVSGSSVADYGIVGAIPVHYGGNPSGFGGVVGLASATRLTLVDDAAHALPASWTDGYGDGRRVGCPIWPHAASCFSFYATKPVCAAEGGMLTLADMRLAERARRLSLHGIDADAYRRSRGGLYHYEVTEHGWKYNLPDLLAALGRAQLARADALRKARAVIAVQYAGEFGACGQPLLALPAVHEGCQSAWHLYTIRLNVKRFSSGWDRDRVAVALRERGISTSLHYRPLHRHPYWKTFVRPGQAFPNADAAYAELLSLPVWPGMTEAQVSRVVGELVAVLKEAGR